jgi:sugar phosphate isomerase/epimerase
MSHDVAMTRQTVLAHFSIRNASFAERCHAAGTAGFSGIGMYVGDYSSQRAAGRTDDELLGLLAEHDTRVLELEALRFFTEDTLDTFVHLVATFGVERIQVVPPFTGQVDRVAAAEWMAGFADRVAPFGASLAIEFLPFTDVPDAASAVEIVERTGRPNVGLCVDSWHVFRGAGLLSIVGLDPSMVVNVQFDDGPLDPVLDDYVQDCLHYREPPGEGEFDLRAFLELLPDTAPLSVEVIDDDLDLLPPAEAAALLMAATRLYL